jgi:hypothetical protein
MRMQHSGEGIICFMRDIIHIAHMEIGVDIIME